MSRNVLILATFLVLSSCISLTKTQIESVNQFAQNTRNFSIFPSKIMTELADIRVKRGIYYANSLTDPKQHIAELDSIFSQKKFDYQLSDKLDVTFKIIDKYSQSLELLTSDNYEKEIEKQSKNFGIDIDSLIRLNNSLKDAITIPSGIGGAVSNLVVLGGKQYVRSIQAKEVRKFVCLADTLISTMTLNLLEYLQSENINLLIDHEEREIKRNYLSFLQNAPRATIESERDYLELKNDIDGVRQLQKQTIDATKELKIAHKKLLHEIEKKKNLKQTISELQELYESINKIKETVQKIGTQK